MTTLTLMDVERALAEKDFREFLGHVFVLEPPPGRGAIPFVLWPHLEEVITDLETNRLIVWLKARQIGASWMLAAYALWKTMYNPGSVVLLFSQGEDESKKLLAKCKFIYSNLPEQLRNHMYSDNQQLMQFDKQGSWYMQALPSTEKAGRSVTASMVIFDEADFHEYLDASFGAVMPTIGDSDAQMIMVSTSDYKKQETRFKQTYLEAPGNGFYKMFYSWDVRPNRDEDWYEERKKEYADPYQFEKEYPNNDIEALSPPSSLMAFNREALQAMWSETTEPRQRDGVIRIWKEFAPRKRYVAATDTSHGVGQDYSVTVILDHQTGEIVASICNNTLDPTALANQSMDLLSRYDNPVWVIEDNDWGIATINAAKDMRYPKIYWRDKKNAGWKTTSRNRFDLWDDFIWAVNNRQIVIYDQEGLTQFFDVIRNPDKQGRVEAPQRKHDDFPIACALAWKHRGKAKRSHDKVDWKDDEREEHWRENIMGRTPKRGLFKW